VQGYTPIVMARHCAVRTTCPYQTLTVTCQSLLGFSKHHGSEHSCWPYSPDSSLLLLTYVLQNSGLLSARNTVKLVK